MLYGESVTYKFVVVVVVVVVVVLFAAAYVASVYANDS